MKIGFVQASGNSSSPKEYNYTDRKLNSAKYSYRLKMIDNDGTFKYSDIVEAEVEIPKEFSISQNYPNPFNPTTRIDFSIPEKGNVRISIFNALGEEIRVILNEEKDAGYYSVEINTSDLPSGVYFYQLRAGSSSGSEQVFINTKKMLLLK